MLVVHMWISWKEYLSLGFKSPESFEESLKSLQTPPPRYLLLTKNIEALESILKLQSRRVLLGKLGPLCHLHLSFFKKSFWKHLELWSLHKSSKGDGRYHLHPLSFQGNQLAPIACIVLDVFQQIWHMPDRSQGSFLHCHFPQKFLLCQTCFVFSTSLPLKLTL